MPWQLRHKYLEICKYHMPQSFLWRSGRQRCVVVREMARRTHMQTSCKFMHMFQVRQQHIDVQDTAMSREGAEVSCERGIQTRRTMPYRRRPLCWPNVHGDVHRHSYDHIAPSDVSVCKEPSQTRLRQLVYPCIALHTAIKHMCVSHVAYMHTYK